MDCEQSVPVVSEVLTVVNGEIIKKRTVVTFYPSHCPTQDGQDLNDVAQHMQNLNIENNTNNKIEYDSQWMLS